MRITRALISAFDKTGLKELADVLARFKIEIVSTGKTASYLREHGCAVKDVSAFTGSPEILGGRVKTLHPTIFGGILFDPSSAEHMKDAKAGNIRPIQLVVVNLYPFEKVINNPEHTHEEAIENIDIGGVSLIRAAAKNYQNCVCVVDHADYPTLIKILTENRGEVTPEESRRLASKAFGITARYDCLIHDYMTKDSRDELPEQKIMILSRKELLRYGENPHQKAALYEVGTQNYFGIARSRIMHGKQLSFNNILDLNAALNIVKELERPACAIIKHTNPCGAAVADSLETAFAKALDCDELSSFGGIIALNREVNVNVAKLITTKGNFFEAIVAPSYEDEAFQTLISARKWSKNLRILACGDLNRISMQSELDIRSVGGSLLIQSADNKEVDRWEVIGEPLTDGENKDSLLAWHVVKFMCSNAICIVKDEATVGLCAGQTSRVDAVRFAVEKAQDKTRGAVLASDGFFPFDDSIEFAAKAGIRCIVQPGGSVNDSKVIAAAKRSRIKLILTGMRHFRH